MNEKQGVLSSWAISLTLHGMMIGMALMFSAQVTPIVQEKVFQWDVALVEAAKPESIPSQARSVVTPEQPREKVVSQPRHKQVTEVSQVVRSLEQNIEPTPLIEQKVQVPQVREEPVEQRVVETAAPVAEPTVEAKTAEPVALAAAPEPTESRPVEQVPAATASASEVPIAQERTVDAAVTPGPEVKADHRWLAESLWRRVAELKRYPNSARMNGQEGKVVVKAVIRSDGHLADVFVQKSSGYSALDAAAIEAVRLACPLHMKHAIGKPLIVVSLPIVYSLTN